MEKAFDTLTASDMETLSTQATQKRESTRAAYESAYKRVTTLRKSYDDAVKAHAQVAKTEMLVAAFKALTDKHVQKLYVVKSKRTGSLALHLFLPAPRIVCTNKSKKDDLVTTKQRRPLVVITLPFANHKSVEIYDAEKWEETSKYVSYPHQTIDGGTPCWGHRGGLPLADQLIGAMVKYRVKQVLALLVEYLHQGGRNHKFRGESVSITNAKDTKRYEHARKEKKRGKKRARRGRKGTRKYLGDGHSQGAHNEPPSQHSTTSYDRSTTSAPRTQATSPKQKRALAHRVQKSRLVTSAQKVRLLFPRIEWEMMHYIVRKSGKNECSGFARLEMTPGRYSRDLVFEVSNLWMTPQRNNSGRTVALTSGKEAWFESEFGKEYLKDPVRRPNVLWWHKHPGHDPGAFSHQDKMAINSLCMLGGFVMSVVTSSNRKVLARLDYNLPISEAPLCVELSTSSHNSDLEIVEPDYLGALWNADVPDAGTIREYIDTQWDAMAQDYNDNPGKHELSERSLLDMSVMDTENDPVKARIKSAANKALDKEVASESRNTKYLPTSKGYVGGGNGESVRSIASRVRDAVGFLAYGGDHEDAESPAPRVFNAKGERVWYKCETCGEPLVDQDQRIVGVCTECQSEFLVAGLE